MVVGINDEQKQALIKKLDTYFGHQLQDKHFAIWGLAFKPNTDDIRDAPALTMIDALLKRGATVTVFDPEAMNHVRNIYGTRIEYGVDEYEVLQNADALLIATEWSLFRSPDFEKMKSMMNDSVIFDGRNLYELDDIPTNFHYESIGRKPIGNKQ